MGGLEKNDEALAQTSSIVRAMNEPQPKKRFNFWTAFGISICTSGSWEGWIASIAQGIVGGGPAGLVWGWVFVSLGIVVLAASLAEFVSMWPSAGGQYVWATNLAPKKYARVVSWFTAWFTIAGLWLGALSCGMGVAVQIQSYVASASDYTPKTWHAFLINIGCMVCWIVVNIFFVKALHWMNELVLVVHVIGYFLTIGVLTGTTKNKHDAAYVFTNFENYTGWDSNFVSWSVGLLSALYAFFSLDAAVHYSDEIPKANVVIPRAMILQAACSSISTFPFIIAVLFCIGDTSEVLASPIGLMSPFTQIVINGTGNVGVSIFLNAVSTSVAFAAGFDLWGAASRSLWSMSRDGGLPSRLGKLHPTWNVPVLGNLVLIPPSIVIYMIYIWNTTAFYGIMAGVLVAFQLSYVIPIGLCLFYARWNIELVKGPFNMGRIGWVVNALAFLFGCFMIIFMSFLVYYPVTAANMNYSCVIIGAIVIFSSIAWFFYAEKRYRGAAEFIDAEHPSTHFESGKAE
ncbi:putative GABA permease [Hypoxylon rubiginosum]|uniref:GABA permease n=1 Tax=Hypoxylon rubiginosum TaxID=110542 RepID=A0ACB9YH58_9PEZI|nr:putative GABA permease [Hypoxylon rubiginosum]